MNKLIELMNKWIESMNKLIESMIMIIDYYLIYGMGPQRINTEGIAYSRVFFLYDE